MEINQLIIETIKETCTALAGRFDKTFAATVYEVKNDGRTCVIVIDNQKREVTSAIGDIELGENVWVKIPCGNINEMHICGRKSK